MSTMARPRLSTSFSSRAACSATTRPWPSGSWTPWISSASAASPSPPRTARSSTRTSHQHHRHARPCRFRRPGRAGAQDGRRRAAAGRCAGRAHAADLFRPEKGPGAALAHHRGHQQDRQARGAVRLGGRPGVRPVREAECPRRDP